MGKTKGFTQSPPNTVYFPLVLVKAVAAASVSSNKSCQILVRLQLQSAISPTCLSGVASTNWKARLWTCDAVKADRRDGTKLSPGKCQLFLVFSNASWPLTQFHVKVMSESVRTKSSDVCFHGGWKQKKTKHNKQTKSKQNWRLAGNFLTFESLSRDNVISDTHTLARSLAVNPISSEARGF